MTQDSILTLLSEAKGVPLSGEKIAKELGMTRAAVWKSIGRLIEAGYPIVADGRRGYRLTGPAPLSEALIRAALPEKYRDIPMFVYKETDSTNTRAKVYAEEQEAVLRDTPPDRTPVIFLAERQTAGRGRRGRSFLSEDGGLYLSLLLRPTLAAADAVRITTYAAVMTADVTESLFGKPVAIKWVNDLYMNGKKFVGILTEGTVDLESGGLRHAVLGIGVDLAHTDFPPEIAEVATSIEDECGVLPDRNLYAAALIAHLLSRDDYGAADIAEKYRARSFLIGKEVDVIRPDGTRTAQVLDVTDRCTLDLLYPDGTRAELATGEVSVRMRKA